MLRRLGGSRAAQWAGPALVVLLVLGTLHGFVLAPRLTNEHYDLLSFWLPRWTFLGRSIAEGHLPVWNPFEMMGYRFAADPQGGWLYAPPIALFSTLSPGGAMRAILVLHPLLTGLGLLAFLRLEGLGRLPAAVGALSAAAMMSTSEIVLSMPFAGSLAWTAVLLAAAAGFRRASRASARVAWTALAAFAWSQVASAHLSHGLAMATLLAATYLGAHALLAWRARRARSRDVAVPLALFLVALPLASLAIVVPRVDTITSSSLREGYGPLEGGIEPGVAVGDRAIQPDGLWAGWPFALATSPGAYAGAAVLLVTPLALRARRWRPLVVGWVAASAVVYVATFDAVVTGRIGDLLSRLPFGDTLIHNPGRLRHVAVVVVPSLAAVALQGLRDDPIPRRRLVTSIAVAGAAWLVVPVALGGDPLRWAVFAVALGPAAVALLAWDERRAWGGAALVGLLLLEIAAVSAIGSRYDGDTMRIGLEGESSSANAVPQPLRAPDVDLDAFLAPTPFVPLIGDDRYLTWAPPAAVFQRGYLAAQEPTDWPALALERGTLFELRDVLGYNPVQLDRYWTWIRLANELPLFYNATSIQRPTARDLALTGVRYLVVPERVPPTVPGRIVARADGYDLVEVADPSPLVSVVADWTVAAGPEAAFDVALGAGFDPDAEAVVEADPGFRPTPGAPPGSAAPRALAPNDLAIEVRATAPSLVVVRQAYDDGWRATVDDEAAPVLAADGFLQAVPVPAGSHVVRLTYRDDAIAAGLWSSAAAWIALALAWAGARVRERRREGAATAAAGGAGPPRRAAAPTAPRG
jgi:hypothetical protein